MVKMLESFENSKKKKEKKIFAKLSLLLFSILTVQNFSSQRKAGSKKNVSNDRSEIL